MASNELMKPTELEFSRFASILISETLDAVISAQLAQEERIRELEQLAGMDPSSYAEEIISVIEVETELARIFPDIERASAVVPGALYTPQEGNVEETPPVLEQTDYIMKDGDSESVVGGSVITQAGYNNIFNRVRINLAVAQLENLGQLVRRGVPRVMVDNGRVNAKLTFNLSEVQSSSVGDSATASTGLKSIGSQASLPIRQLSRSALPLRLTVKPVDVRRPELSRLTVNVIGEVEMTFKTVFE